MKIVNNNIYITRGETDTYNAKVIDKDTGAPFVLPKDFLTSDTKKFLVQFSVRRSEYVKDGSAIKKYIWLSGFNGTQDGEQYDISKDIALLNSTEVIDLPEGGDWKDYPMYNEDKELIYPITDNVLYRRKTALNTYDYRYYDGKEWKPYSFVIKFPFLYRDTAELAPKAYKYAMTIYGGNNLVITNDGIQGIDYKKPLVDAQFVVEADINE